VSYPTDGSTGQAEPARGTFQAHRCSVVERDQRRDGDVILAVVVLAIWAALN
jgi:hypothetical protein